MLKNKFYTKSVLAPSAAISLLVAIKTYAAPGILEDIPLNIGTRVQPNILFLLDDSGSMDWEVLKSNGAEDRFSANRNSGNVDMTPTPTDFVELLESCAGYNVMYYNNYSDYYETGNSNEGELKVVYEPWSGQDLNNLVYNNMPITAARLDPYFSDGTDITGDVSLVGDGEANLLTLNDGSGVPGYIPWDDADNDGEFDVGECHEDGTVAEMYTHFVSVDNMDAQDRQNFANWFSYYRKREYVAKKALSDIIIDDTNRVGLATLHNNGAVGTIIEDVDDITPVDSSDSAAVARRTAAAANKEALLDNLFTVFSDGGTPLRTSLEEAGRYYEQGDGPDDTFFGSTPVHSITETVSTDSPILNATNGGTCQQHFTVVFSDGFWNGADPTIENTDEDGAGDWDGDTFADTYVGTLADVAMHYYERDLSSGTGGLANDVNVPDIHGPLITNSAGEDVRRIRNEQHMVTYTIAFGVNGSLTANPDQTGFPATGWPEPVGDTLTTIDDMRHAAWNGRGEFLNASDPQQLIDSLTNAIGDIEARTGTASSASFNAGAISSDTLIFQSTFNTSTWYGDLLAFRFDDNGIVNTFTGNDRTITDASGATVTIPVIDEQDAVWSADEQLTDFLNDASGGGFANRNVITYNGTNGIPFATFPVDYNTLLEDGVDTLSSSLSDEQIAELLTNSPHTLNTNDTDEIAANAAYGQRVMNFIRGDNTSSDFRNRANFLGPFVYSVPEFVGVPSEGYPDLIEGSGNPYSAFVTTNTTRTPLVYIGGNDGMLHAFNASVDIDSGGNVTIPEAAGNEVFAYIPSPALRENRLSLLTENDYTHHAYVDGSPAIRDVFVNNAWRTYLVGSMRSGGKGVFVLDVTNPTALANASDSNANADGVVVGEFTHPDLGFTFSRPQIAKMNNGEWAAIFGNGYNNDGDGTAKLFILFLENLNDADTTNDFLVIETGVGSITNSDCLDAGSDCNGLSSPTLLDLNGDSIVDRVYAGDLHGNLWGFDFSSATQSEWEIAHGTASTRTPLFAACSDDTSPCTPQPITTKPVVDIHPSRRESTTSPNLLVYFGTGQYLAQGDNTTTALQSVYGIWDAGSTYGNLSRANIVEQSIVTDISDPSFITRTVTDNAVTYDTTQTRGFGWYIDLEDGGVSSAGERSVSTPLLLGDILFFTTILPSTNICDGGGSSFLMAVEAVDGSQPDFPVFDLDGDGNFDDNIGGFALDQIAFDPKSIVGGSDTKVVVSSDSSAITEESVRPKRSLRSGRKSWSIIR